MSETQVNLYPSITISLNKNPNRMYAIPLFGALIKFFMLIPVFLILIGLAIASNVLIIINSFMVLSSGKYWDLAYNLMLSNMRYSAKTSFFMAGLTDTYPGFDLQIKDNYIVDIPMPKNPNKLFAIPIFGGLARILMLIPFAIVVNVISSAASFGVFMIAWAFVLFTGKFPEAFYELYRDSVRLSLASSAYITGLSDKYPSFWISMNHKGVKIALIVLAVIMMIFQYSGSFANKNKSSNPYQYQNQNMPAIDQSSNSNYR